MKNLKKLINLTCWMIICFLLLSPIESMGQVKNMSAKDLTEKSTAVLHGKCKKLNSEWNEDRSIILTYVTIEPEEYIKGNLGSEVIVTVPGGRVDNIIYEVSEMPVFTEGEEVVAFIWTNPAGKNLVTGGFKGKMKIETDKKTGKKMVEGYDIEEEVETEGQVLDDPSKPAKPDKVKLEDLVTKLKEWAKN